MRKKTLPDYVEKIYELTKHILKRQKYFRRLGLFDNRNTEIGYFEAHFNRISNIINEALKSVK